MDRQLHFTFRLENSAVPYYFIPTSVYPTEYTIKVFECNRIWYIILLMQHSQFTNVKKTQVANMFIKNKT